MNRLSLWWKRRTYNRTIDKWWRDFDEQMTYGFRQCRTSTHRKEFIIQCKHWRAEIFEDMDELWTVCWGV